MEAQTTNHMDYSSRVQYATITSPWRNAYWFARMLISNDKYGGIGKETELLTQLVGEMRAALGQPDLSEDDKLKVCLALLNRLLTERFKRASTKVDRVKLFIEDVTKKIENLNDLIVFIIAAECILIPINNAMTGIPSNDREYSEQTAKAYLDALGTKGLATVIKLWDDLGVEGCLNAERASVVNEFTLLRNRLETLKLEMDELENNMVLTAFVQEFERRLSQKRKTRAGGSLEDVTTFLFNTFNIQACPRPEHFQADVEVDKWFKCSDGWLIGISCKRTLRERWKQVSSADRGTLSRYKIKELWHIVTYDEDLSDDKLTMLGQQSHIFYLPDESRKLLNALSHVGMKAYVRPLSKLIDDIRNEQKKSK